MSTPERPQDPGEHGYGGTKQDYQQGEDDDARTPTEDDDADDAREAPDPQAPDDEI